MIRERHQSGPGGSSDKSLALWLAWVALAGLSFALLGCASDERSTGAAMTPSDAVNSPGASVADVADCEEDSLRECHLPVAITDDVLNCYEGLERCVDGSWGACEDGEEIELRLSARARYGAAGLLSLSLPADCIGNPCNPRCREFIEEPAAPIVTTEGSTTGFRSGDPDSVPNQADCEWGGDCQDNFLCDEPLTATDCEHSKCLEGNALDATCRAADPCVDAICADNAACCSTAWDAACVDAVKTICDAFCGAPVAVTCEHHACDEGVAITCDNDCAASVCALDSDCCNVAWDASCVALATSECGSVGGGSVPLLPDFADLCGYAVYSYNDLYLGQEATLTGLIGAGGNAEVTKGNLNDVTLEVTGNLTLDNTSLSGNAIVGGNVELRNSVTVSSSGGVPVLEVGGTTTINTNSSSVTGDVVSSNAPTYGGTTATPPVWTGSLVAPAGAPVTPRPTIPTKSGLVCDTSLPSYWANPGDVIDLPPGNYNEVGLNSNSATPAVLRLHEGSYTFNKLTLNSDARVEFDFGTTGIDINVCDSLAVQPRTYFTPTPSDFRDLRWYYGGSWMYIDQQGGGAPEYIFPGMLIAPNAYVAVAPNTEMQGVVYADSIRFEPGLSLLPADYASGMCGASGSPTCDPGIDMGANPTIDETGTCVAWATGQTDATCGDFDIALGVPCEDAIVVCNHGMSDAPAGVRLAFFDTSYPWADTSPDTSAAGYLGDCSTTEIVPSGECISQACDATPLTQDLWVVAIPPAAGVSECSTLDNWAHYSVDEVCSCFWGGLASGDADSSDPSTCSVALGDTTTLDLGAIDVSLVASDGTSAALGEQSGSAACGDGWYLSGSDVVLCPSTCATLEADSGSRAKVAVGCAFVRNEIEISETYESDCEEGTMPQWDILTWDTSTPLDSAITFEVRTADSLADLFSGSFEEVGIARNDGTIDTQVCDAFNTSGECPVVLTQLVDDGVWEITEIRHPVLELKATLTPAPSDPTQGPEVNDWQVQFTCLESE